jgi:SAM-dependent methyltransferase
MIAYWICVAAKAAILTNGLNRAFLNLLASVRAVAAHERLILDIADGSIQDATSRLANIRNVRFPVRLLCLDCFTVGCFHCYFYCQVDIKDHLKPEELPFDVASAQFALHYAFESEAKIRQFLKNVSECIRVGGYFIGTIPNANRLVCVRLIAGHLTMAESDCDRLTDWNLAIRFAASSLIKRKRIQYLVIVMCSCWMTPLIIWPSTWSICRHWSGSFSFDQGSAYASL